MFSWGKWTSLREAFFTKLLRGPQSNDTEYCGAVSMVQRLSHQLRLQRIETSGGGTGCWRWQIAEACRASSITPRGSTVWLPSPQETWSSFHLYKTGVFGGSGEHFRAVSCYLNLKKGALIFFLRVNGTKIHDTDCREGGGFFSTSIFHIYHIEHKSFYRNFLHQNILLKFPLNDHKYKHFVMYIFGLFLYSFGALVCSCQQQLILF